MKALSNIWRTVALSACAAVVVSGMTACSAEDNMVNEEQTPAAQQEELKVTLTATFDDGAGTRGVSFGNDGMSSTSTFADGDKIYVYNETQDRQDGNHLTVSNISADGKTADFTGTLNGGYNPGDALILYYNVSYYNESHRDLSRFNYQDVLDGSASSASACDYAIANANVGSVSSGTLTLAAPVTLQKMQSVFRQRLTFKNTSDGEPIATPNIVQLTLKSQENKLNRRYFLNGDVYEMPIAIPNPTIDSNKDIYLALRFSDGSTSSDALTFTAMASNGNVYVGTKTAPSGGFKNGKYYYGNLTLVKSNDKVTPTISWYNVLEEVIPDSYDKYQIKPKNDYIDIGLSGISKGYQFHLLNCSNAIVRLNSLTAKWTSDIGFLYINYGNIVLDITGINTIECPSHQFCFSTGSNIKLSGSGTLTVTASQYPYCGIYGENYQNLGSSSYPNSNLYFKEGAWDVTNLIAADGYTVMRSARSGSGPYTWTYTVSPKFEQPTITWNTVVEPVTLDTYSNYKQYQVNPSGGVIDFTLSGNSSAYTFNLRPSTSATVHLNGLNALNVDNSPFISSEGSGTLTLNLTGDNTINCRNWAFCILAEGDLKLSGNGTLTVTSNTTDRVGIYANNNYNITNNNNAVTDGTADVSALAATGSTVTRSAVTNNNNGTYTWTYTVTTP
ncbi:MAG: hypothetical protein J6W56_06345 [Prevotella sp.]|nr:hypothetical protein [Prevotella sp.]